MTDSRTDRQKGHSNVRSNRVRCALKTQSVSSLLHLLVSACDAFVAVVYVATSADCNSTTEYTCVRDGRCKPLSTWCDGTADCLDQSDERAHCRQWISSSHQSRIFILVSLVVLLVANRLQRLHCRASVCCYSYRQRFLNFWSFLEGLAANAGQPGKWPLKPVLCVCVVDWS